MLATEEDWHIKTPQLNNNGGNIHSGKKLHIETPKLNNTGGSIDGSEYHLQSSDINNQGGHLIGRNKLHIETDGEQLNNQGGQIVSQDELRIDGKKTTIDSSGGYIVGNNLNVDVDSVKGGKVESWADLQMRARRIDDLEEVHTGGNMDIQTEERYTFNAPHYSGGWARISGSEVIFTPDAKFEFKENASITSDSFISNEGQIAAYGTLLLKAGTTIENRHRAKIQGGHVAMEAQSLKNFDGATIAAADRIDLAAGEIINEGSARIESVGGLHVGRTLDGNHQTTGQADLLRNDNNGEINVDGDATFNAARIENIDSRKFIGNDIYELKEVTFYSDRSRKNEWIPEEYRSQTPHGHHTKYHYILEKSVGVVRNVAPGKISVGGNLTVNADSANNEGHITAGSIDGTAQNMLNGSLWDGWRTTRAVNGKFGSWFRDDYQLFNNYTPPNIAEPIQISLGHLKIGGDHNGNRYDDGTGGGGVPFPGGNGGGNGSGGNDGTTIVDFIDKNGKTVTYQTINDYQPTLPQDSFYQINPDNIAAPEGIPVNPARGLYTLDPTFARILEKHRPELFKNGELISTPMNPHYDRYSDLNDKGAAYSGTTQGVPYIDFSRSIGDRYYNQELVRNQIARLTGYRYLKGFHDDSSQFNALVDAGERLRAKLQLAPGVALTAEHMKSLSEDVVLMVNKTITLPDGRQIVRQVPQVYAQKRPDDLDTSHPTIGANRIALKGNYHNNAGDIGGRDALKLYYRNIDHSGTYTSNHGDVHASDTYNGSAGTINAGKYFKATAGKQFNFQPKTADHNENAAKDAGKSYHNSHTITAEGQLKRYATGSTVILGEADETNIGTTALDLGDKTSTTLIQGKKTDLGAEFVYEQTLDKKDAGNYDYHYRGEHKGVHTSGDGKLAVIATDGKLTMKAAELDSGKSQVYLYGAKGVDAEAGEIVEHTISARESKQRGFLKRTHTRDYVETEIHQNKAGTITGDTVVVAAGQGDINATGMHIVSDHGTMLHTDKGDINLKAGKNSYRSVEKHSKHKTGLMGSGGWGVFLGSRRQSGETELNIKAPAPTLVGAIDGNIHIQAGGHYDGTGALVHAGREGGPLTKEQWLQMSEAERNRAGNIYFSAESGSLRAARGSQDHEMHSHYKQTGFTANLGGAVVNVAQTALQTMKTLSDGDNARVRTMNTLNNTWANYKGIEALRKALTSTSEKPDSNLINIQISLGGQHSTVHHKAHEDTLLPSQMTGDSGVYVDIKGKGEGSTLDVISSDLAGSAITRLNVEGKKTFAADSVKKTIESSQHSGGGGGGIAIMLGSNGGGLGVIANANIGKGKTNGNSTTYRLSHIGGLQGHTDIGDGKTLINGAQILGKSLEGNTRDLVAISPQGTMDYDSNNFALSGFVLYGAGAALGIDYEKTRVTAHEKTINKESGGRDAITSVSSNNARINAWKKDVQQNDAVANAQQGTLGGQSGFFAGDDGFRIKNSGTATLEGATFVSTAKAEAEGKNHFSTDRLIRKDLENHSEYKGKSVALGLSAVFNGDKNNGTSQQIQWLGENFSPINVGESGMSSRFGYDRTNKNDRGTTYASINTANITINDAAGQQALTGESVADTIRNANRGMTLATAKEQNGAADAHFDAAKVENSVRTNAQVMKTFTGTVQDVKGDLRKWAEENRRESIYQRDPEKRAAQLQRAEQQEQLAVAVDMLGGALTPANSVAGSIANTLAPAITHKIGQEIKKRGLEGTPEHIALHAVMAGARTALNGGSTGEVLASAAITGTAEYSTPQLAKLLYDKDISQLTVAEKSALGQTIGALTTGAGAMTGGNSATAYNAGKTAQNAVENNLLGPISEKERSAARDNLEWRQKGNKSLKESAETFIDRTKEDQRSEELRRQRNDGTITPEGEQELNTYLAQKVYPELYITYTQAGNDKEQSKRLAKRDIYNWLKEGNPFRPDEYPYSQDNKTQKDWRKRNSKAEANPLYYQKSWYGTARVPTSDEKTYNRAQDYIDPLRTMRQDPLYQVYDTTANGLVSMVPMTKAGQAFFVGQGIGGVLKGIKEAWEGDPQWKKTTVEAGGNLLTAGLGRLDASLTTKDIAAATSAAKADNIAAAKFMGRGNTVIQGAPSFLWSNDAATIAIKQSNWKQVEEIVNSSVGKTSSGAADKSLKAGGKNGTGVTTQKIYTDSNGNPIEELVGNGRRGKVTSNAEQALATPNFVLVGKPYLEQSSVIKPGTTVQLNQSQRLANGEVLPEGSVITTSDNMFKATLPNKTIKGNIALTYPQVRLSHFQSETLIDDVYLPGLNKPIRPVNPDFPPNINAAQELKSKRMMEFIQNDSFDCSEIADIMLKSANNKGYIMEVKPIKQGNLNVYENGSMVTHQYYHQVYTDGKYVFDPRVSTTPIPKGDWEQHIRNINNGDVIIKRTKQ